MSMAEQEWMKSEYFVPEIDNWHLREDAPEELKQEFEEYMQYEKELKERGIDL